MFQRTENISNLLHESPSLFLLSASRRDAGKITLLFSSALAAREGAYMLRGDWDGVNAVTIYQPDVVAVQNTLALLKLELGKELVEFCHTGDYCYLPGKEQQLLLTGECRSGKSLMVAELLIEAFWQELPPPIVTFNFPQSDES